MTTLIISSFSNEAIAGAWTRDEGRIWAKAWVRSLGSERYTNGAGETSPSRRYRELSGSIYAEYGLSEDWTVWGHWDVGRRFQVADETVWSLGDPSVGARWRITHHDGFSYTTSVAIRAPLATNDPGPTLEGLDTGAPLGALVAGPGAWGIRGALAGGHAWQQTYVHALGGYEVRLSGAPDLWFWGAEVGHGFDMGLSLRAKLGGSHPLEGTGSVPFQESPSGLGHGTSFTTTALEAEYTLGGGIGVVGTIQFSLAGVAVRRQARGLPLTLGLTGSW